MTTKAKQRANKPRRDTIIIWSGTLNSSDRNVLIKGLIKGYET